MAGSRSHCSGAGKMLHFQLEAFGTHCSAVEEVPELGPSSESIDHGFAD